MTDLFMISDLSKSLIEFNKNVEEICISKHPYYCIYDSYILY